MILRQNTNKFTHSSAGLDQVLRHIKCAQLNSLMHRHVCHENVLSENIVKRISLDDDPI